MDDCMMWYHGNICRGMCEDILIGEMHENPYAKGVFLVRDSSQSTHKFVLSCYTGRCLSHYSIRQHANDSFFSINDRMVPIQGLDEFIKFFQENDTEKGVSLVSFIFPRGSLPPVEFCKQGNKGPLHNAVLNNDIVEFTEVLRSEICRIDSKDSKGRTPLHLCCMNPVIDMEIPMTLIEEGAAIVVRDWAGFTPFMYACQQGHIDLVGIMIKNNKNIIQMKNSKSYDVALHYAAKEGKLKVVKILLRNKAALRPRNKDGKFPIDLAADGKHHQVVMYLNSYRPNITTNRENWDHGTLCRDKAQSRLIMKRNELQSLNHYDMAEGLFLIRFSTTINNYVISMLNKDEVMNYEIKTSGDYYHLDEGACMKTLEELIEHHMEFVDGLANKLTVPVEMDLDSFFVPSLSRSKFSFSVDSLAPLNSPSDEDIYKTPNTSPKPYKPTSYLNSPEPQNCIYDNNSPDSDCYNSPNLLSVPLTDSTRSSPLAFENPSYFTKCDIEIHEELYTNTTAKEEVYAEPGNLEDTQIYCKLKAPVPATANTFDDLFIDDSLEVSTKRLGEGFFGSVQEGILVRPGKSFKVAVKTLNCQEASSLCAFLREAGTMMNFDNPYIVKMVGIAKGPPMRIVQELQALGSLLSYLEDHADEIDARDINTWATQIAAGMKYLESKRFVHRDLAARNILLASKTHARISDFGLSRTISVENNTFRMDRNEKVPVKWYAPEVIGGTFSHASDVWSFGVTLWEAYSKGEEPYESMSGQEVLDYIKKGHRLEKPEICSDKIYKVMLQCWQEEGEKRPNFQKLSKIFKTNAPIYENKSLLVY